MKTVIKRFLAGPLRRTLTYVLQRTGLRKFVRRIVMRMPGLHGLVWRVMFQAPVTPQPKISVDKMHLSPNGRRAHRALKQAIRTHQR